VDGSLDGGTGPSDSGVGEDAGPPPLLCDPEATDCLDADGDGILDDGDLSGVKGDAPCRDGVREGCDDNCRVSANPFQDDGDNDGSGDPCDPNFCRSSSTLVAVGYGDQVHVSKDQGLTWALRRPGQEASLAKVPNWEDIAHGRGTWIANNSNGNLVTWARSEDGLAWTTYPFSHWQGTTSAQAVGYANGLWVLGSEDGRLAVSYDDGLNFSSIGAPQGWNGTAIEAFAYHGGRLIAVGDFGQLAYSDTPDVASSWKTQQVGSSDFKQIVVVAGTWVAAGKSTCFYSDNRGQDWTSCNAPADTYYGLHYSGGLWMLGALNGGAWASRGKPNAFTERVFAANNGAWPVYGDCGSGRWFAGHEQLDPPDPLGRGLRMSEDEGRDGAPALVFGGASLPLYGITGD
jgi:hypothetical protein